MGWKQVRSFNQNIAGTVAGYCLANVRKGYGIGSKYATAWDDWKNTIQHKDRNVPLGIAVPLYYSYYISGKNYGHINVRMPDGRVWSDGKMFNSIADYESKKDPVYVGWGEEVNDIRVIQKVADPAPSKMPPVGSVVELIPRQARTTFKAGTTNVAGTIKVVDDTYDYQVRGYDPKYPGRILINSKSAGGNGVALALYYTNGARIEGWTQ